ncbi:DNA gyrase inhibitor YacG [Blastomonas aquatica]|uniref:DNA gyrase inhibitor YacG n=1 Tax=Blastomonas aquatica TaxID=1510276 RepID=UPI0016676434|nr:DNA gyrase inhibitor YacG [Blastomonas aquatica]
MSNPRQASRPCPLCRKPARPDFTPFCSKACKDRDLLQWLGGGYAVPGPPADEPDADYD